MHSLTSASALNTCSVFMPIQLHFFFRQGSLTHHRSTSWTVTEPTPTTLQGSRVGGWWSQNLIASRFFLFLCSNSVLHCLCLRSSVCVVTNLVALSQLNKSLSVYRVPHCTHARQEFTVMCLRRKYIQMFMRHHLICGHL